MRNELLKLRQLIAEISWRQDLEDFKSIYEALYLLSIPRMRESLFKGRQEPSEECSEQLDW